ncbi:MAG: FKBP-type peptidyl-prolyl cis-trans isomerase [Saprospiraceae bacterium]|jgi:FKBP-type peptidyl-prolyl cis-trans isomerase FklB|nr:FKBP-type peptidyl-prolyl cis-trans isomerase [Saprospiraceae bacterium]
MNKGLLFIVFVFLSFNLKAQSTMDSLSYSVGVVLGKSLKQQGIDQVDAVSLARAIEDYLGGKDLAIDERSAGQNVNKYLQEKQAGAGEAFLAENGKRPEVTTTASGLQYEVLKEGDGPQPNTDQKVTVHYHGTLIDGTVFDSSVERGRPASFGVTQVIQGWVEGLQLMSKGSKYKFYIPYNLAYGERGAPPKIQPYAALIFEVELLDIN